MQAREAGLILRSVLALGLGLGLRGQGSLLYADPVGRGIRLAVVEGPRPGGMSLRPEQGDEGRFRKAVLALAGAERPGGGSIQLLVEPVPPAWKVGGRPQGSLVRIGAVTFWRFRPGQVLPARFHFEGRSWALQSADLPDRDFRP